MFSIGLVLSAGGVLGDPWHSGVLARLQTRTGWDPRGAALIVGTSAGSITAVTLRAGVPAVDRVAHFRGESVSERTEEIYSRITTRYSEPETDRDWRPLSPRMALRAAWPPWNPRPVRLVAGGIPRGTKSGESLEARMNELHGRQWPDEPTWIVAVRADDGRRIVFGRDDVRGNIGQAVRASAAVPGVYVPGRVGEREYVDGGVHSATNADLTALLGFDLVVVSSSMTTTPASRSWVGEPTRTWFSRKLDDEVAEIRRHGTAVAVFQPDAETLPELDKQHPEARARAVEAGAATVDRVLDSHVGEGLQALIARAV